MKCLKDKRGFTLVELLVAITILGIIMVIALPQISNIQQKNQKTKYKKYAESMLSSAKLYTDSYTEDMFGNNASGCVDVPYADMKDKDLLKDIKVDGSTCSSEDTFVRVRKANDHYFYETSVYCKDKNGKVVYDERLTKGACDGSGPDEVGPQIKITPNSKNWTKGTNQKITIKIWDDYGMLENTKVNLSWTKDGVAYGAVTEANFKNKRYDGQSETTAIEYEFTIPQNQTGIFVLTVTPVDVRDSLGNYQTTPVVSGQFKLDNEKPTITKHTNDSNSQWVNRNVQITAKADDNSRSGVKQIYYYYTSNDKRTDWDTGSSATSVVRTWSGERNQQVYVIAKDNAGNYSDAVSVGYVRIDKTAPTVTKVTNSSKDTWTNSGVKITATSSDTGGSGIAQTYYYYTSDDKKTDWDPGSTASSVVGTWYAEINQEVFVIAEDKAGNYSEAVSAGKVMIDKTKPVITSINNPKNGVATTSGLKVTLTGYDSGTYVSGIAKWKYKYPNTSWIDISNSASSPYVDTWSALREKTSVIYSLCDVAGNCSDTATTSVFIVDKCDSRYITYTNGTTCSKSCGAGTYNRLAWSGFVSNTRCTAHDKSSGGSACNLGSCTKTVNATKYASCNSYYITTCTNGICNYTQKNGRPATGTISESQAVDALSSECNQSFCSPHLNKVEGNIAYYNIYNCTIKDFGVTDGKGCVKGEKKLDYQITIDMTNTAIVNKDETSTESRNKACAIWVTTNEPFSISSGQVLHKGAWHTYNCGGGMFCSNAKCLGDGNCVKPSS